MPKLPALLFLWPFALAMADTAIWPVDSLIKVFPDDQAGVNRSTSDVTLLARNGHASLQFAVRANAAVSEVNATVNVEGPVELQVRHVGYVPVHANTPKS